MDEARARALLELAAGTEAPPPRVDVELARNRGRRRLRWRAAGLAAVPVLAAVTVVGVAVGVPVPFGSGGNAASQGRGGSAVSPETTPTTQRVTPPRKFNPLIPYAAFGWLPRGESLDGGQIAATNAYLTAGPRNAWALTVFGVGRCDRSSTQLLTGLRRHRQPLLNCTMSSSSGAAYHVTGKAPPVDGHLAFWTTGHGYLVWEYARGSWAALAPPGHGAAGVTIKVADHVRYDVATKPSIEFAAQLTGLPAAWRVDYVYFVRDAGVLRASQYTLSGPPSPNFTVDPATRSSSCYFYPHGQSVHRVIDGYRVTVNHFPASSGSPPEQQVCAPDADGLAVFISSFGKHAGPNAVSIFASHMRLLGTNPADWTTDPVTDHPAG